MAEIAEVLWRRHLGHNPANPRWENRDRFVLSNGHGSMLLYALLQDPSYRDSVLPPLLPCVAVEAGSCDPWHKYVGRTGAVVGIDRFGESAPAGELFKLFGFTAEHIAKSVMRVLV